MQVNSASIAASLAALDRGLLVRDPALPLLKVLLTALSETEARFASDDTLPAGTTVRVRIDGIGSQLGRVTEADARSIVVTLATPLDAKMIARALRNVTGTTLAIPQLVRGGARSTTGEGEATLVKIDAPGVDGPAYRLTLSSEALARAAAMPVEPGTIAEPAPDEKLEPRLEPRPDARALGAFLAGITGQGTTRGPQAGLWLLVAGLLLAVLLYLLV
jgi:hypothetical protein